MTGLRPVTLADVDALQRWRLDPDAGGDFQWFGFQPGGKLRREVEEGTTIDKDTGGVLAVVDDGGGLVGDVQWIPQLHGPLAGTHAWMIGIMLLPEHRGQGHGTNAQRQLAAYLFSHTVAERIEADTDVGNLAEQRALAKAGFSREGVLRRAQFRAGHWHDMAIYSRLRGET